MAKVVLKNAFVSIDGNDLSAEVRSITLTFEGNVEEFSAMGDNTICNVATLKNWSLDVTFRQDYTAASVDDVLFALIGAAAFPVILRPDAGVVSATNPQFAGTALLTTYPPLSGAHGSPIEAAASFVPGGGDLVRTIA